MSRRVLRWDVLINDAPQMIGGGKLVLVGCRLDQRSQANAPARRVEVWTEEDVPGSMKFDSLLTRRVIVVGTAYVIPPGYSHIGSAVEPSPSNRLVWHIYEED